MRANIPRVGDRKRIYRTGLETGEGKRKGKYTQGRRQEEDI